MKKTMVIILGSIALMTSCSSVPKKEILGQDLSWYCGDKASVKKTGFKSFNEPGKGKGECVEVKADRDPYWDFYLREYETDELPDMPNLP